MRASAVFAAALLLVTLGAGAAGAQSIGIYFDPDGARCSGPVGPGPVTVLYVLAYPGGLAAGGFAGVQFRIAGIPDTWNEGNALWQTEVLGGTTAGHPLYPREIAGRTVTGVVVAFPVCHADGVPPEDVAPVLVGTVRLILAPTPADVRLRILAAVGFSPTDPPCPFLIHCGPDFHIKVCAAGGEAILNNTGPDCTVAVQPSTWGRVKEMYREPR